MKLFVIVFLFLAIVIHNNQSNQKLTMAQKSKSNKSEGKCNVKRRQKYAQKQALKRAKAKLALDERKRTNKHKSRINVANNSARDRAEKM
jgi:hypothetical protein